MKNCTYLHYLFFSSGFTGILGGQKNDVELIPDDGLDEILSQAADEVDETEVPKVPKPMEEVTKPVVQRVREAGVPKTVPASVMTTFPSSVTTNAPIPVPEASTYQNLPNDRKISINLTFNFGN